MISNLIEGIKIIKLYGWEFPLLERIKRERRKEIKGIKKLANIQILIRFLNFGLDGMVIFVPLILYINQGNTLSP